MNKKEVVEVKAKEVKKVEHVETQMGSKAHENIPPVSTEVEDSRVSEEKPKKKRYPDVSGGLIFITLGIILLLNNFGLLPWEIWANIWKFWPVFIIIGGLNMLFNNSWWKTIVMFIFTAILLSGVIIYSLVNSNIYSFGGLGNWIRNSRNIGDESYIEYVIAQYEYENIDLFKVNIKNDIGTLKINDTSGDDNYVAVYGWYYEKMVNPVFEHNSNDNELSVLFEADSNPNWFNFWENKNNTFKVELGELKIPVELEFKITSGKAEVQLENNRYNNLVAQLTSGDLSVNVEQDAYINDLLKVNVTSGNADIDLSDVRHLPKNIEINVTSGNVELNLPEDVGLEIEYDVTAGSIKVGDKRLQGKGDYTVEGDNEIKVKVKVTSGNVEIKY